MGDAVNWRDPSGLDGEILAWVTSTAQRDWERELEFLMTWMQGFWDVRMPLLMVDKTPNGTQTDPGNQEEEANTCSRGFLREFIAEHGSVSFSANGGRTYGGGFSISLSSTGIAYWVGGSVWDPESR